MAKKGVKFTEEHKRKIGLANKGKKKPPVSKQHRKRLSEARLGDKHPLYGKHHSKESKLKMSKSHTGKKFPEERKNKMRGKPSWNKGIKGEKSHSWKGGISFEPYPVNWTDDLKNSIRKRDNYTCQILGCGIHQDELDGFVKKLDVHHKDYNKDNLNPDNLIALCKSCHTKTNSNRDYWIKYFNDLAK